VEFVSSFDNFNAYNIFHSPRFQPWEKKNQIQKNHTGYKPENSKTDFIFFLKIVHRHRLQTGANKMLMNLIRFSKELNKLIIDQLNSF